jgi:hypothetical protein
MIEHIPLALSSLKAAKDIITTIQELKDIDKIMNATIELKERLIESIDNVLASKEQLLTIHERMMELEKENNRLKDWSSEKEKYEQRQIGNGVFVYIDKNFVGMAEKAHKLCCNCFDNKNIKSTLQQSDEPNRLVGLTCPNGCPKLVFYYIA